MDEETISPEQVSCSREIGDDPAELAAVAAEVVAGKPIVNARIKNLRALIEAVQQHPGAKLAPPSEERDEKWRPLYSGSEDVLTTLEITGGEILEADCDSLDCRIGLVISASFADYARFSQASFADAAWFEGARFGGEAWFRGASFTGEAWFSGASFTGPAWFDKAIFGGKAWFEKARFGREAWFEEASFVDTAWFDGARFTGPAWFDRAIIWGPAWFDRAIIKGRAWFKETIFVSGAGFEGANFAGPAWFDRAIFAGNTSGGDLRPCSLRTAIFAEEARALFQQRQRQAARKHRAEHVPSEPTWRDRFTRLIDQLITFHKRLAQKRGTRWLAKLLSIPGAAWIAFRDWCRFSFGWKTVRSLGQLQILNRVSIIALLAVPLLAALTDALQALFEYWPPLGSSAALAFFAAAAITIGLLIYQIWAPEEVRKFDEDEFIDRAHRRYPEKAADRNDGLRRAIEQLELIAEKRADRHPNFVKHHGDTIWIPPRDRIDWFEDIEPTEAKPPQQPGAELLRLDGQVQEADQRTSLPDESLPEVKTKSESSQQLRLGTVPGAERARITIEEGAKAEYWLKSRTYWGMAAVSFIFYLAGIGCLIIIIGIQSYRVGQAAGWWGKQATNASVTTEADTVVIDGGIVQP